MALVEINNPTQIERAVESYLTDKIDAIQATALQRDVRNIFSDIGLTVAIVRGRNKPLGGKKFNSEVVVNVMISFADASGEEARREGCNPLVMGIQMVLARQNLGLNITDLLPRGWEEVTTEELWEQNKIVYNIEFETSFTWKLPEDGDAVDLIGIAVDYFLEAGDETADAQDELTTNQGEPV